MLFSFYPALIVPVDEIVTMVVAPYLITKFAPTCVIVKLVVAKLPADPLALPVTFIAQVPDAPVPVGEGTSVPIASPRFVRAVDAVDAFVPPLASVTGALI
jgi:hypothetical protein